MKKFSLLLLVLITGCVSNGVKRELTRETATLHDKPPAFVEGYTHGCSTGKRAAGMTAFPYQKDLDRFSTVPLYRDGWKDGFEVCRGQALATLMGD